MKSLNQTNDLSIIWLDRNIFTPEYQPYLNKLGINFFTQISTQDSNYRVNVNIPDNHKYLDYDIRLYKDSQSAIEHLKTLKFNDVIIIVGGNLYDNFVEELKQQLKDIYIIPKIIVFNPHGGMIFSRANNPFNCCRKEGQDEKFFYCGGFHSSFDTIKNYIDSNQKEIYFDNPNNNQTRNAEKDVKCIFDPIEKEEDLILPTFYKVLIDISKTENNNLFIQNVYRNYNNQDNYKKLLRPIVNIPPGINIPVELLSKYYARIYTIEGDFYKRMKQNLLSDHNENNVIYQPYIKTLYEGVKKGALKTCIGKKLYSAQNIPQNEIQNLDYYKNNKKVDLPMSIIFSKGFLSFSKDLNEAEKFFLLYERKNALLIIEDAKKEYDLFTHADIEELSFFPNEKEVLFFPFSAFGIDSFEYDYNKNRYEIKLIYLGKFIEKFKNDKKFNTSTDVLPNTKFKALFQKSGLVEESTVQNLKIKDVSKKYKKYKEPSKPCTCSKKLIIPLIVGLIIAAALAVILPLILRNKEEGKEEGKEKICEEGSYYDSDSSQCLICGAGYYSSKGAKECTRCQDGYSSYTNSSSCFLCQAGSFSNNNVDRCTSCEEGTYSKEGASECLKCPEGTFSNTKGATSCNNCPAGTSPNENKTSCLPCPKGTFIESGSSKCTQCPEGTYSDVDGSTSCTRCPAGTYPNENKTSCTSCPKGTFSEPGSSECTQCPAGTYSDIDGSTSCTRCPEGTYANMLRTGCNNCEEIYSVEKCIKCPEGTYSIGNFECSKCQAGTYSDRIGKSACISCPAGTASVYSRQYCKTCPKGYFSRYSGSTECRKCDEGTYSDKEGSTSCIECPSGTISVTNRESCSSCPKGYFSSKSGSSICTKCSEGYYQDNTGSTSCKICPAGTKSVFSKEYCESCSKGYFSKNSGSTSCSKCPEGTYADEIESTSCTKCPPGTASVYSREYCSSCPKGYHTKYSGSSECNKCPEGTYSDVEGASSCNNCPAGTESVSSREYCNSCAKGYYAKNEGSANCSKCPKNTYSDVVGAKSCSKCDTGYCSNSGAQYCYKC